MRRLDKFVIRQPESMQIIIIIEITVHQQFHHMKSPIFRRLETRIKFKKLLKVLFENGRVCGESSDHTRIISRLPSLLGPMRDFINALRHIDPSSAENESDFCIFESLDIQLEKVLFSDEIFGPVG